MKSRKIEQRIQAILDPSRPRRGSTRLDLLAMAAVAALVAIPLSGVKAQTPVVLALTPPALGQVDNDLVPVQKFYELSRASHREVVERQLSGDSQAANRLHRTSKEFDAVDIARLGDPSYIRRLARRGIKVALVSEEQADTILAKQGGSGDRLGEAQARKLGRAEEKLARAERRLAEKEVRQAEAMARTETSKARMMGDRMREMEVNVAKKDQALAAQAELAAKVGMKQAQAEIQKQMAKVAAAQSQAGGARQRAILKIQGRLDQQISTDAETREKIAAAIEDALAAQKELGDKAENAKRQGSTDEAAKPGAPSDDSAKTLIETLTNPVGYQAIPSKEMAQISAEVER